MVEVPDVTADVVLIGSSVFNVQYAAPLGFGPDDNAIVLIYMSARQADAVPRAPTSVSYGNIPAAVEYQIGPVGASTGNVHSFVAMVNLRGVTPADNLVRVNWTGLGAEIGVGYVFVTAIECSADTVDFGAGFVELDEPLVNGAQPTLPPLAVVADDIVLAVGSHFTGVVSPIAYADADSSDAYAVTQTSGADAFFNGNHNVCGGFLRYAAGTAETESAPNFLTGFGVVLRGIVVPPPSCDDIGRATRAYVSAYDLSKVHQARLYRFAKRCLIANFNGAIPRSRLIVAATWRTDAPEIGVMSAPQISANQREATVLFASQLGGWANLRVDATLDNGEIYPQVFRINVREASYFFNDPPTQTGPFSVTVTV